MTTRRLLIFGMGYSGRAVALAARARGFEVAGTSRTASGDLVPYDDAGTAIAAATHILSSVAPDPGGDPVLARYAAAIQAAPHLRWCGYLSSTVVYGDRGGGWVDEDTPPAPSQARGERRVEAERAWAALRPAALSNAGPSTPDGPDDKDAAMPRHCTDIFRLAGIYGPGRSAFDDLRAGRARRMVKPGHAFGRIHRDDIAQAVVAAMTQDRPPGTRVLNLADDHPSESAAVVTEAAALLGIEPPPEAAFADALPMMSPMARSFWAENRKVASRKTQESLGIRWLYPSYREGLRAILGQERAQGPA